MRRCGAGAMMDLGSVFSEGGSEGAAGGVAARVMGGEGLADAGGEVMSFREEGRLAGGPRGV